MIQARDVNRLCRSRLQWTRRPEFGRQNPTYNRADCWDSHPAKAMPDKKSVLDIASSLAVVLLQKRMRSLSKEVTKSRAKPMPYATSTQNFAESVSSQDPCDSTPLCSDHYLQRANGAGRIVVSGSERGTRITDIFQRSPIRIMFPRVGGAPVEEAVLINTTGGVAGGDCLECAVTTLANASIRVTSQAAEKVYRALNEPAHIATKLKAHAGGRLAWLPQETIVFNWARLHRTTEIELVSGAELLALEWLILGRAAHGEVVIGGHVTDAWRVKKDGRLIWMDGFRITDGVFRHLHRKALLSDCKAIATLIYFGPDLERRLELLREIISLLGCNCGATLVGGLIVVRFAAKESSDLKLALRSFLEQFGPELGTGPFQVPKMWSC